MGMRWVSALLVGLALAITPASALAKPGDVATTRRLALATDALVRAATPDVPRGLAAVRRYAAQTAAQCPGVALESPQDHDSEQLSNELVGAMTAVGYRTAAAPIATFAHAVEGLRWSNHRLTRAVHTLARKLQGISTLATPNLCGDIQAWVASHYTTLPASTVQFDRRYAAVETEAEEVPLIISLATPYASPVNFTVLRHVERLEAKLAEAEAHAVESYVHLMNALDLQP